VSITWLDRVLDSGWRRGRSSVVSDRARKMLGQPPGTVELQRQHLGMVLVMAAMLVRGS
jgi:hypothetical protein